MGWEPILLGADGAAGPGPGLAPPSVSLAPCAPAELHALVHSGENECDACERILAQAARVEAALDLAIGEGLLALLAGDRLIALGFSNLRDYAREVLDLGGRTAEALVQLARELRTRPLLAAAVRAGEVRLRAAQTVLPVAVGDAEARWVARAGRETVRALEAAVREERAGRDEGEDEWTRLRVGLSPGDRATVDEALAVAGKVLPGSSRAERLEAMAQEWLGEHPVEAGDDGGGSAGGAFRADGDPVCRARREERLEAETDRWSYLVPPLDVPAPDLAVGPFATEVEIDARLRELAVQRAGWDRVLGWCAFVVRRSGLWRVAGFDTFEHYCKERLGLSVRAVEQRAALERRLWASPALRAARDTGLPYEKLRLLSRLPDGDVAAWVARTSALTVVELRAALADRDEAQMRAARILRARLPERVARLLQAAFRAVRAVEGKLLGDGLCLVRVAQHFLETWRPHVKRSRTPSQKVRDRDLGRCQVPGCSLRAVHAHHIVRRSRGGGDEPWNLVSLCASHHLRGIHGGYIRVSGRAPDALAWEVGPRHAPVDLRCRCVSGLAPAANAVGRAA
jgi:5-methylcytosine-specific restriction endonuclease McrA